MVVPPLLSLRRRGVLVREIGALNGPGVAVAIDQIVRRQPSFDALVTFDRLAAAAGFNGLEES